MGDVGAAIRGIGEDDRLPPPDEFAFTAKDCSNWVTDALKASKAFNEGNEVHYEGLKDALLPHMINIDTKEE